MVASDQIGSHYRIRLRADPHAVAGVVCDHVARHDRGAATYPGGRIPTISLSWIEPRPRSNGAKPVSTVSRDAVVRDLARSEAPEQFDTGAANECVAGDDTFSEKTKEIAAASVRLLFRITAS